MHVTDRDLTTDEARTLDQAMYVVDQLSRDGLLRVVRHLLRAGLVFRRTKDAEVLKAAMDSLGTLIKRSDDDLYQKHLHSGLTEPRGESIDPQKALAALRQAR